MIQILPLQIMPLNLANANQKEDCPKEKNKNERNFIAICRSRLNLHLLFRISMEYWFGTVIRLTAFCNYSKPLVSFAATSKQYSDKCTFRMESSAAYYTAIYICTYIFIDTLSDYLSGATVFHAQTSELPDVSILSAPAVSAVHLFFLWWSTQHNYTVIAF